jgi:hypothetical protein
MEPLAGAEGSRVIVTLVQPVKPVDLRELGQFAGLCGADTRVCGVETRLDALRWLHAQASRRVSMRQPEGRATSNPPSVFTAVQELGLKLEPQLSQVEFLVIDHVEDPAEK